MAGAADVSLWHLGRSHRALGWVLPATIVATAAVAVEILARTPGHHPWLRPAIAPGAAVAAARLLLATYLRHGRVMAVASGLGANSQGRQRRS